MFKKSLCALVVVSHDMFLLRRATSLVPSVTLNGTLPCHIEAGKNCQHQLFTAFPKTGLAVDWAITTHGGHGSFLQKAVRERKGATVEAPETFISRWLGATPTVMYHARRERTTDRNANTPVERLCQSSPCAPAPTATSTQPFTTRVAVRTTTERHACNSVKITV